MKKLLAFLLMLPLVAQAANVTNYVTDPQGNPATFTTSLRYLNSASFPVSPSLMVAGTTIRVPCYKGSWIATNLAPGVWMVNQGYVPDTAILVPNTPLTYQFSTLANLAMGGGSVSGGGSVTNLPWLDLKQDFGAWGDGLVDDTVALQNAVNALTNSKAQLRIPVGTYRITDTIHVPLVGTNAALIEGDASGWSIILADLTNQPAIDLTKDASGWEYNGLRIKNLTLNGPLLSAWDTANLSTIGILAGSPTAFSQFGGSHWDFDGLKVNGFQYGMVLSNLWGMTMERCTFESNRLYGVQLAPGYFWSMRSCEFKGGFNGYEMGVGLGVLPIGGVSGEATACRFAYCTNGVLQLDATISYIACSFENCGAATVTRGPWGTHLINCSVSELFNNTGNYSITNGYPGFIVADGVAAYGLSIESLITELDGSSTRAQVWTYPTNYNSYGVNGTNFYMPNAVTAMGGQGYLQGRWGTNAATVTSYPIFWNRNTAPVFDKTAWFTNSDPNGFASPGIVVQNGSDDRTIVFGADFGKTTSTGNTPKGGAFSYFDFTGSATNGASQPTIWGGYYSGQAYENGILTLGGYYGSSKPGPYLLHFMTSPQSQGAASIMRWSIDNNGLLSANGASSLSVSGGGSIYTGVTNAAALSTDATGKLTASASGTNSGINVLNGQGTNTYLQNPSLGSTVIVTNPNPTDYTTPGLRVQNGSVDRTIIFGADNAKNTVTTNVAKSGAISFWSRMADDLGYSTPVVWGGFNSAQNFHNGIASLGGVNGFSLLAPAWWEFYTSVETNNGVGVKRWAISSAGTFVSYNGSSIDMNTNAAIYLGITNATSLGTDANGRITNGVVTPQYVVDATNSFKTTSLRDATNDLNSALSQKMTDGTNKLAQDFRSQFVVAISNNVFSGSNFFTGPVVISNNLPTTTVSNLSITGTETNSTITSGLVQADSTGGRSSLATLTAAYLSAPLRLINTNYISSGFTNSLGQIMANALQGIIATGATTNNNVVTFPSLVLGIIQTGASTNSGVVTLASGGSSNINDSAYFANIRNLSVMTNLWVSNTATATPNGWTKMQDDSIISTNRAAGGMLVISNAMLSIYDLNNPGIISAADSASNTTFSVSGAGPLFLTNINVNVTNGTITITNTGAAGDFVQITRSNIISGGLLGSYGLEISNRVNIGGAVYTTNTVNVGLSLDVGGQSYLSNSLVVTSGGAYITGSITNANSLQSATNAFTWANTLDANLPIQFWSFATNVTISGIANLNLKNSSQFTMLFSNAASGLITISLPAGTRLLGPNITNQPLTTLTVTNGKIGRLDWLTYPHLGQNITSAVYFPQVN